MMLEFYQASESESTDMNFPTVSFIIVGRNCEKILPSCIHPILAQDYPCEKIELLFIDGASTDNSREVAGALKATVIEGGYSDNAEARRYVGVKSAKNDILCFIDTDNIIPYKNWLKDMVLPFMEYPELVGAFTKWYGFDKHTAKMDQYYALIGGNDPIVYYLGKNDRVPYLENTLPYGAKYIIDKGHFTLVSFEADKLPVLGCNGFLLRKHMTDKLNYANYEQYLHIDVHVDIIKQLPNNSYAIVNNTLLHLTGETLLKNIRKRIRYMNLHYLSLSNERRYKVFNRKKRRDILRLAICMLCAFTLLEPLWRSYKGWRRTGNIYWFYHPIVTFSLTMTYAVNLTYQLFRQLLRKLWPI